MNKYIKSGPLFFFLPLAIMPNPVIEFVGSAIGTFFYLFIGKRRRTAVLNARFVTRNRLDKKSARKIAKKSFENFVINILYNIKFYFHSDNYLRKYITIENSRHKLANLDGGVALFAHLGNWELIPLIIRLINVKGAAVYRPMNNDFIDSIVKTVRKRGKIALIPKRGAVSKSIELLKEGFFVGIDGDQNVAKKEGIEADFLGVKAYTPKLPSILAIRGRKKIYPIFLISEGNGRYRFIVEKEISAPEDVGNSQAMRIVTEKINQVVGKYVTRYPDQWLLMHRRWKNREDELKTIVEDMASGKK